MDGGVTLVYGTGTNNIPLIDWFGIVVEKQEYNLILSGILEPGETKVGETLPNDGFILFVNENDTVSYPLIMNNIAAGNKITVGFNYKSVAGLKPDGTSYGNVMINLTNGSEENNENNPEDNSGNNPENSPEEIMSGASNNLRPINNPTSTEDFININLYDYTYKNASNHINTKYISNGKYPKFQGSTSTANFNKNSIYGYGGFDANIITDMDAITAQVNAGTSHVATDTVNETYGSTINRPGSTLAYGGANVPVSTKPGYNTMHRKANRNNYPQLSDGTSLGYLFGETNVSYVQKKNSHGIDGLFQYDAEHDRYYFDSTATHAQYNNSTGNFDLYDKVITPSFIVYPFGNFMPFNDIQQAKQVSTIKNSSYFSNVATSASNKSTSTNDDYAKLATFLNSFVTNAGSTTARNYIKMYSDVHRKKYFDNDTNTQARAQDNADYNQMLTNVYNNLSNMYNIDYDEQKNFFFGMTMEFNFVQPTGGINQFGDYVEPVTFDFSGDDDVWVYVDDTLVLDLTGIHRVLGGQIDFSTGEVHYYAYNFATLDAYTTPYTTVSFAQLFDDSELTAPDANGHRTLKNGTNHNLKLYFMERGAGSSVCKISFNLQESYINGQKNWVGDTEADRPEQITVNLYQNDELYTSTTTTAADDWKFQFINIPFYDVDGNRYLYRIEEALDDPKIRCYEPEYYTNPNNIHEKSITNTFKYRDVSVSKIWDDNNNEANLRPPGGIQVELTATVNGQPYTIPDTVQTIVTLDDSNDWKYEWQRIDRFDADGNDIVYSVDEINLPGAYCNKIEEEEGKEYSFIITNTIARSITITKCDEKNHDRKLGNAQFKLEKLIEEDGEWVVDTEFEPRIANTSTESGSLGVLVYDDLFYGKYRLTEVKAPAGYKISSDPIEIDVTTDQINFNVTVTNKKGGLLPFTGGNGIVIMETMGATMLILSISKYKRRRRVVEAARRIRFSNGRIEFKKYKK